MLTELIPDTLLDRSPGIVIELNVCRTRRCRTLGAWIGRIMKMYDYINRVSERDRHPPVTFKQRVLVAVKPVLRKRTRNVGPSRFISQYRRTKI